MSHPAILIIGATSDMARATALYFASRGFDLLLTGRDPEAVRLISSDITIRSGRKATPLLLDVLDFASHAAFVRSLPTGLAGVLCFAGYLGDQKRAEIDPTEALKIMQTNYTGCVSILSELANYFEGQKNGVIVGVSSVAGDRGRASNYFYGSAKAGFTAFLSGLRNRMSFYNVHVVTVKPGFVYTRMTEGLKLPGPLTATPEQVAQDIFKAWNRKKNTIYTRWFWRWIMQVICSIPEWKFKKMKL